MLTDLLQVALPFFMGLVAGHVLGPRRPDSRLANVSFGIVGITAIWVFMPNLFGLPVVAAPWTMCSRMMYR